MQAMLKYASKAREQGSLFIKHFKKHRNPEMQKLNTFIVQQEQISFDFCSFMLI